MGHEKQLHDIILSTGTRGAPDDLLGAAMRDSRTAMVIAQAHGATRPLIFANDAFLELTGYSRDEVIGKAGHFLSGPGTDSGEVDRINRAVAEGQAVQSELLSYRKDGSSFWNAMQISPINDANGAPSYWLGVCGDVTERRIREAEMRAEADALNQAVAARAAEVEAALAQKTTLLHEVDHRVKNNLQLISSLMLLQSRRIEDPAARAALRGMLDRVSAVATVHRRLFQNERVARFDVAEFMRDLIADLIGAAGRKDLQVRLDLERVEVPSSQAAPIALVLNELVTNAIRHAYPPERGGEITARLNRNGEAFEISVCDRGVGFADPHHPPRGFGLTIVQLLSQQLRAETKFADAQPGVYATVRTPLVEPSQST
jgi:PAS domain S-box-containing protein